ncbi:SDR family oxidoreductase [Chitinophaga tropicalis]|uniref:SDR family NAD(P)-dependent oxidoreductase n=1 Tax=Chitinophaga tropicalis TaxID=2683588 RepID=A0A7K1U4Z4_9BACT|nr:SDR family oxidoreductase [Chitinophaga tropicalis]MVT09432.1 SDR family NAD(P)-dependent oxidoreductase [Chitinophaga tropicalis]
MKSQGKIIVVTGGASGIGLAMAKRFIAEGATVIISDINEKALIEKAQETGATPIAANVSKEEDVRSLVEKATGLFGRIDVFVSNAGVARFGDVDASEEQWDFSWHVNVMSQVYAAKYVLPQMLERGEGYLINTASAAGLLVEFHSVLYSTTKHASIGLAEWLAATYRDRGIRVSVVCPGPVRTPMAAGVAAMQEDALEPEELVDMVIKAMDKEIFMVSSHEKIWKLYQVKGQDYEKYMNLLVERRAYKLGLDEKQQPA